MARKEDSPSGGSVAAGTAGTAGKWTFFTNHAHVLFVLASDPESRLRDVAERVQITERATQRIVHELEEEGYLRIVKQGRRNRYVIQANKRLRHPIERHRQLKDLIEVLELEHQT